jgi:replicative DNA helicase
VKEEALLTNGARLRVPPQSIEAEQSVLGALLLDSTAFDRVGDLLTEADFYRFDHRVIFGCIRDMHAANRTADVITVFERLRDVHKEEEAGGITYLNALAQSVPSAGSIRRHAEIVRERSMRRQLIAAQDQALTEAWDGEFSAEIALGRAVEALDQLQRNQVRGGPREVSGIAAERCDHYAALADGRAQPGYPTGLRDLDAALNGGLQDGRVYVLAARPSIGKTSLALQIAIHRARQGDGVLFLSQEMPAEECADRLVSNLGHVDYGRLQRGETDDATWSAISQAVETLHRMPLWIDDQPALRIGDIRAKASRIRSKGLRLVILDYLQLCSGTTTGKGVTRNSELEEICRGLKALAKQLRVPIVVLSQLSREVERRNNPEPTLADLRDSGAIEQDADCVMFLWRVRTWSDRQIMGLSLAKNRQGATVQRIPLEFFGQHQWWVDTAADISPTSVRASGKDFE